MNQTYEKAILKAPTQYFWMHRRFKNRPKGEERREKERNKRA